MIKNFQISIGVSAREAVLGHGGQAAAAASGDPGPTQGQAQEERADQAEEGAGVVRSLQSGEQLPVEREPVRWNGRRQGQLLR